MTLEISDGRRRFAFPNRASANERVDVITWGADMGFVTTHRQDRMRRATATISCWRKAGSALPWILSALIFCQAAVAGDLIESVKRIRANNRAATIDLRDTLQQYIPLTMTKEEALNLLVAEGFKLHFKRDPNSNEEVVVGRLYLSRWIFLGDEEVRVIVKINDAKLTDVAGWVSLKLL